MGAMQKRKGAVGEREAIKVLTAWLTPVADMTFSRNHSQVASGGYDVLGLDWLAIEVKRHETENLGAWWRQTVANASVETGQLPFLMYRRNRQPWRVKTLIWANHAGVTVSQVPVIMDADAAAAWLCAEVRARHGL